jgi:hypothetical protein
MTAHVVAIAVAVGGAVIMSGLSLVIGILRGEDSVEADFLADVPGKPRNRPRHSPLSY